MTGGLAAPAAPLSPTARQQTFKAVVRQSGIPQDASSQTLRHSDATHLRERGVLRRGIQDLRGHKRPRTTARYPHLPPPPVDVVPATITALMADLCPGRSLSMPAAAAHRPRLCNCFHTSPLWTTN